MIEETKFEVETENFQQTVVGPTHFSVGQGESLIDQTWTNKPEQVLSCNNLTRATSDHNVVQTIYRTSGSLYGAQIIVKRKRTNFRIDEYQEEMAQIDWDPIYQLDNVDIAYDLLESKFFRSPR